MSETGWLVLLSLPFPTFQPVAKKKGQSNAISDYVVFLPTHFLTYHILSSLAALTYTV
jgi:hypothetical protein